MNARLILTTSCLLLLAAGTSQAAGWEKLPPLPEPVGGSVVESHQGRVIIAGGTNWKDGTKRWLDKVRAFDPATMKWETWKDLDRPVAYTVSGIWNEPMKTSTLVFGGGIDAEGMQSTVQTLKDGQFTARQVEMPANAVLCAGGVHGRTMVFAGGAPDTLQIAKAGTDTWSVDLETLAVTTLAPHPGKPFVTSGHCMDLFGRLYVFGGGTWDEKAQTVVNLDEAHAFDARKNEWKKLRPLPYAARGMTAVALYQEKPEGGSIVKPFVYLAGGYKSDAEGFTNAAWLYDTSKDRYRPAPPLPYKAMVALVVHEGFVYCLGGEDKKQSRTDAFFRIKVEELMPE